MDVPRPTLLNYALYQVGWFACVLGAAWQRPVTGFAIAVLLTGAHLWLAAERGIEARLLALALALGVAVESFQVWSGTYRFTSGTVVAWTSPPWLLWMWAQFATTFRYSLRQVMLRPLRAALFGVVGGPLAFLAGQGLGAVTLAHPLLPALARLACAWGLALCLCAWAARRLALAAPHARYRLSA